MGERRKNSVKLQQNLPPPAVQTVSQVETAICVRERVAECEKGRRGERGGGRREMERNQEGTTLRTRARGGREREYRSDTYICMSAEGTMYSNCEEKRVATFRGKVIGKKGE